MIPIAQLHDSKGVIAVTDRLVLRRPDKCDKADYIDTIVEDKPFLRDYKEDGDRGRALRDGYWDSVMDDSSLFATVSLKENGAFCGYCSIEKPDIEPYELGINLRKSFQAQGIGPEVISALVDAIEAIMGPKSFAARIDVKNRNSQVMFRRLGFVPAGVDTSFFKDPEFLRRFEEEHLDCIDDDMRKLAAEFGVEPRVLLSHVLVFERSAVRKR